MRGNIFWQHSQVLKEAVEEELFSFMLTIGKGYFFAYTNGLEFQTTTQS